MAFNTCHGLPRWLSQFGAWRDLCNDSIRTATRVTERMGLDHFHVTQKISLCRRLAAPVLVWSAGEASLGYVFRAMLTLRCHFIHSYAIVELKQSSLCNVVIFVTLLLETSPLAHQAKNPKPRKRAATQSFAAPVIALGLWGDFTLPPQKTWCSPLRGHFRPSSP